MRGGNRVRRVEFKRFGLVFQDRGFIVGVVRVLFVRVFEGFG